MGSEKSLAPDAVLVFESRAAADRRVAGVAAAARAARSWAEGGEGRIWLALPGGGPLDAATSADLERLVGSRRFAVRDSAGLAALLAESDAGHVPVVAARIPATAEILRATAKASDGAVASSLNRPISRRLSAILLEIPGITPLAATAGTALLAAAMFVALVFGHTAGLIAGGLLFQAASIFDGVDGEIARATFRTSAAGAKLDSAVDALTNFLFVLGVTINLDASGAPYAAPLGAWGLTLLVAGLLAIGWRTVRSDKPFGFDLVKQEIKGGGRWAPFVAGFAITVTSRDFFAFLFAVLIVANRPMAVLVIFATAATIWFVVVLASFVPARRELLTAAPLAEEIIAGEASAAE